MCHSTLTHLLAFIVFLSFSSSGQMWEITRMIIFVPKLVLRSSRRLTSGTKHQRKEAHDMEQRLKLFQTGQISQLMAEACHEVPPPFFNSKFICLCPIFSP